MEDSDTNFLVSRDKFKVLNRLKPVALPILDGVGYLLDKENNAIIKANMPYSDGLQKDYPMIFSCFGSVLGVLVRQIDNLEVDHFHIDTVRYASQDFSKVNDTMVDIRNYANCDTKRHVGIMDVAILAVKAVGAFVSTVAMTGLSLTKSA